ncbi:MAG: hypothetical protein J7484_02185 [Microbacterium sp.]|nr:hypothetical protein [Microbacterium sp.]
MSTGARPAWGHRRGRGDEDRGLWEQLAIALSAGDESEVCALLHSEAAMLVDSGGLVPDAAAATSGRDAVAAAMRELVPAGTSIVPGSINGDLGLVLDRGGAVVGVVTGEIRHGRLRNVWAVCSPEKLRHWRPR